MEYPLSSCLKLSSCHGLAAIITLFFCISLTTKPCSALNSNTEFIKTSCRVTRYPQLCFKTLSAYAGSIQTSPIELANAALNVSLKGARSTSGMVLKLSKGHDLSPFEAHAIMDCVENMGDSVDQLQQSLVAMKDLEGPDFDSEMSNILTWVSAALTDEDTCMDGFEGNAMNVKIKDTIRSYVVSVAQLTSNALALVNRLSSTGVNS